MKDYGGKPGIVSFKNRKLFLMNRKLTLAVLIFGMLQVRPAHAQMIEPDLADYFSPSVIARVYEIAGSVRLSREKQFYLARHYKRTDSLLVAYLSWPKAKQRIDSLNRANRQEVVDILGKEAVGDYGQVKSRSFANTAAEGELSYVKAEYKPDSANLDMMKKILRDKYRFIYQTWLLNDSDQRSTAFIKETSGLYDLFSFYPVLYSRKFAEDYLGKLASIKRIDADTIEKIKAFFYATIQKDKYADWSNAINHAALYYLSDTAVFSGLYHDMFDKQAYELSEADPATISSSPNRISPGAYDSVLWSDKTEKL